MARCIRCAYVATLWSSSLVTSVPPCSKFSGIPLLAFPPYRTLPITAIGVSPEKHAKIFRGLSERSGPHRSCTNRCKTSQRELDHLACSKRTEGALVEKRRLAAEAEGTEAV